MSFQPSRTENLKTLFHGNRFVIPSYQRKYSWRFEQRKALWDDITENLEMNHFIGTLCFQKNDELGDVVNDAYEVIDGQQRITTLYILLNVLIECLADSNQKKDQYTSLYIGDDVPKLIPLGKDKDFTYQVIHEFEKIDFESISVRSQIQLYNAKSEFKSLVGERTDKELERLISYVSQKIEILIFNVKDHAQAIKMFSVINDRGLPLSNLDKTKSALMLYSAIYLNNDLSDLINEKFGHIYDLLDNTILLKDHLKIFRTLDEVEFENSFFTQHYYSIKRLFPDWDYNLGASSIFKQIKRICEERKNKPDQLRSFILDYIKDFYNFAKAYSDLLSMIQQGGKYSELFQYLEFTATLYPLIVRLQEQGKLDDLLDILEVAELRVYKLKNTNPRRNMYHLASEVTANDFTSSEIHQKIKEFIENFLNDYKLKDYMNDGVDQKIAMVRYLLYKFNQDESGQSLSLEEYRNIQVEHIFSVSPNFDQTHYGFDSTEAYEKDITLVGNLTILEKDLNKKVRNMSPPDKQPGYAESTIRLNAKLMANLDKIDKNYIANRNEKLIDYCANKFRP